MNINLITKTYPKEGDFQHVYSPLRNLIHMDGSLGDFTINIKTLPINVNNPISIECQPSYDGTVNLIISDDENPIRLINSRFSKIENGRFKIVNRDQLEQSNIYKESDISTTNLVLAPKKFPKLKFKTLRQCGILMGGNYTFYMKYVDGDGNESDFVAETFQIPIYKGTPGYPYSISGTLSDERTDKAVVLSLSNLETSFQKVKLYFSRETSDLNGYRFSKASEIITTFPITGESMEVLITGREEFKDISLDIINLERFTFTSAKTQCQVQNMLFLGNLTKTTFDLNTLRNISLFFNVEYEQNKDIGWVDPESYKTTSYGEYYDAENVCYRVGYWPSEFYRLGVVYVMEDGSHTDVFNLRGCRFNSTVTSNLKDGDVYLNGEEKTNLPANSFLDKSTHFQNTYGVFQNPLFSDIKNIINYSDKQINPLYFKITLKDKNAITELKKCGVKGLFFVRQKRIPFILFQGLSLDVDRYSGSPMLFDGSKYYTESFLTNHLSFNNKNYGDIVQADKSFFSSKTYSETGASVGSVLISPDASFVPELQNMLCGSIMQLEKCSETSIPKINNRNHVFYPPKLKNANVCRFGTVFVNEDVPYKIVNDFQFSTRFGSAESTRQFSFFGKELDTINEDKPHSAYNINNRSLLRGIYTSCVGVCGDLEPQCIYTVRLGDYTSVYTEQYIMDRGLNHSAFFPISDKIFLSDEFVQSGEIPELEIWGGDCYTNTVTIRLNRNFTDPDAPINDYVLSPEGWRENYKGYMHMYESKNSDEAANNKDDASGDYYKINRGDLNSAPMGMWVTLKLLSSYNLGFRAEDRNNVQEMALIGNPRSFYPITSMNPNSAGKISETKLLNLGYSATVGAKEYYEQPDVPYLKDMFDNRIIYSNIQVEDDFKNGYRVFSPLAYQDIDRQYGAIVKLLPYGTNLFCVFEHGIGLLPVNEKALIPTEGGGAIHLFGANVLPSQVRVISSDFGSIWADSIIKTNIGIYGVDTYAKKIWRYTDSGFETISDMNVQRFLNDNITLSEKDKYQVLGLKNVKTHFNAFKGDVMFTFYNHSTNTEWNLCYNERLGKWITKYSWTPLCSENINNIYYSLDKKRAGLLGLVNNLNHNSPINVSTFEWENMITDDIFDFETQITLNEDWGNDSFNLTILSGETSYLDVFDTEHIISIPKDQIRTFCSYFNSDGTKGTLRINKFNFKNWFESLFPEFTDCTEKIESDSDEFDDFDSSEGEWKIPKLPLYLKINVDVETYNKGYVPESPIKKTIVVLAKVKDGNSRKEEYDNMLVNGFYVHGRAGIFDEINYKDNDLDNQILPTKWYDKQEPFELEFVINSPVGLHKIFDNLVIISNNVEPNSIEYTIEGDTYSLFKDNDLFNNNIKKQLYKSGVGFKNAKLNYDTILNQYSLTIHQDCKNMANPKFGRRLGNIQYKEDSWYVTIDPLVFDPMLKASPEDQKVKWASTRIRDKFLKVRVKYTGEDLVIITAIKNLCTLSRA